MFWSRSLQHFIYINKSGGLKAFLFKETLPLLVCLPPLPPPWACIQPFFPIARTLSPSIGLPLLPSLIQQKKKKKSGHSSTLFIPWWPRASLPCILAASTTFWFLPSALLSLSPPLYSPPTGTFSPPFTSAAAATFWIAHKIFGMIWKQQRNTCPKSSCRRTKSVTHRLESMTHLRCIWVLRCMQVRDAHDLSNQKLAFSRLELCRIKFPSLAVTELSCDKCIHIIVSTSWWSHYQIFMLFTSHLSSRGSYFYFIQLTPSRRRLQVF